MQCDSLAKLITDTLGGLGFPEKSLCEVESAARAVVHSLALLKQTANFSAQNLDFHKYQWSASHRDSSLLALEAAIPAWVERRVDLTNDYWKFIPTCNLAVLEDARLRGDERCAFYTEDGGLRIKFSYEPTDLSDRVHRLWYDTSVFLSDTFNDTVLDAQGTGIPSNFFPYLTAKAEMELIPTILIALASSAMENKDALAKAFEARQVYLTGKIAEWADRYSWWVYGSRGGVRGRRRRSILSRGALP